MTGISGTPTTCLRLSFSCSAFPFLIRSTTDWKHMPPITRLSRLLTILARLPGGSSPRVQRLPFRLFARSFVRSFVSFRFVSFHSPTVVAPTSARDTKFLVRPTIKTFHIYFRCLRGGRRCFE